MARLIVTRELIGAEDLNIGEGTFERTSSTGETQTMNKVSLKALGHNVYNVQDYIGGAPSGSANNTVACQAAIDACELTGGTVLFPASVNPYRCIGLTVNEPINIMGEGRMTHIKSIGDGSIFIMDEGTNQNVEGQNPGLSVANMYLTGNSRLDNAQAFSLSRLDHANFENLWIEEFLGTNATGENGSAFTFKDSIRESHFTDIRMRYCGTYNSKWVVDISDPGSGAQDPSNNNLFTRCTFVYYFGDAVVISDPGDASSRIRGNRFLDCLWHGVLAAQPIHTPTANDKKSRSVVITNSEANVIDNCRFSTGPVDNPYIYADDDNTNGPTTPSPTLEVRDCLFTNHAGTTADLQHGINMIDGTFVIRGNTFVVQLPAWETASGVVLYRDDSNIFIGAPSTNKIIEAAGASPAAHSGDAVEQDLGGTYTIETKAASGALTRRFSAAGGTDTKELKLQGATFRVGAGVPSHTTDAYGTALGGAVHLYLRNDASNNDTVLYVTYNNGTTWAPLTG